METKANVDLKKELELKDKRIAGLEERLKKFQKWQGTVTTYIDGKPV